MEDILVEKLALGTRISDDEIASALYEICNTVYPKCGIDCPVFRINGNRVVFGHEGYLEHGCECFRFGSKMLSFMRSKRISGFTF
jgi:hypothetical protein